MNPVLSYPNKVLLSINLFLIDLMEPHPYPTYQVLQLPSYPP